MEALSPEQQAVVERVAQHCADHICGCGRKKEHIPEAIDLLRSLGPDVVLELAHEEPMQPYGSRTVYEYIPLLPPETEGKG